MRDESDARPRFRIRMLGTFTVERDGTPLAPGEVGSKKGRTALKLLLTERGRTVSAERLIEALWGEDVPDRADANLASLVSRLRALLGPDAIAGGRDGYRFVPAERVWIDADEAERLTSEAESRLAAAEPALAAAAAGQAVTLLDRGELLADDPFAAWWDEARAATERLRRRAWRASWRASLALGAPVEAGGAGAAAAAADPLDEDAHRALMTAYRDAGEPARALATYERLRARLEEDLGTDPAPETRDLHLALLRDEPVPATDGQDARDDAREDARRRDGRGRSEAFDPAFLGRDAELQRLRDRWADASAGTPALVVIHGEAGIGKTTLADQMSRLARATGGLVVGVRCFDAERSLLLQPWADAVRAVIVGTDPETVRLAAGDGAATLADLVPEVRAVLRPRPTERVSRELERRRTFEAVTAFFRTLARDRPALLVFDDLHNAAASTLELLHFAARRLRPGRVLVLATVRSDEGDEALAAVGDVATVLELGPLSGEAVSAIAASMGAPQQAERIRALTRGHPLFVVEALRALAEGGGEDRPVPESLRAAVLARLRRLGPEVDETLRAAATFGSVFDPGLVARLMEIPIEQLTAQAHRALRARLVIEADDQYAFANDLIREVIYQTTPMPARVSRHRRAAELLADRPEAAAEQALAAGDLEAAAEGFLAAGDLAARRYANRDAVALFDRAMDAAIAVDDAGLQARIRLARSHAREVLRDLDGALEDATEAVRLARETGQPEVELAAHREMGGDLLISIGAPARDCAPHLEIALEIAERVGDRTSEAMTRARFAILQNNLGRLDLCRVQATRAVELARDCGDPRALASALDAMKTSSSHLGDLETLRRDVAELEALLRREGDFYLLQWAVFESSFLPMAAGRWDLALRLIDEAIGIGRRIGDVVGEPMFLAHRCWVGRARGDYAGAVADGKAAVQSATTTAHRWWNAIGGTMLAWTYQELGAHDRAIAELELALANAERSDSAFYLVRCLAHLAWSRWCTADRQKAERLADRTEAVLGEIVVPEGFAFLHGAHASFQYARVRQAQGRAEETEPMLRHLLEAAEHAGWLEVAAGAGVLLGRARTAAGDDDDARRLFEAALSAATAGGTPHAAWEAHLGLAALEAAPAHADAAKHLDAARAIARDMIASVDDPDLRASAEHATHAAAEAAAGEREQAPH
jgi:DNA-binding SARP family transcriptional activator